MNHLVSQVVAAMLVNGGFGKWNADLTLTAADWAVAYQSMPPTDEFPLAIMCANAEGKNETDKRSMRTGEPAIFPGVSVQVRAYDDLTAVRKAHSLAAFLDKIGTTLLAPRRVTIEGWTYCVQNFTRMYDPVFLMQEDRDDRRVWVFRGNVTIHVQES